MGYEYKRVGIAKPVAPWVGGKHRSYKFIVEKIVRIPHKRYAEPFVGMGGIFLRRQIVVKYEFINDYNKDVSNLFRVLRRHYNTFIETLHFLIASRDEFERQVNTDPKVLTDVERAVRFLYIQRLCYAGKSVSPVFGVCNERGSQFNIKKLESNLDVLYTRLSDVVIECLPYESFMLRYDNKDMLFYLDPPYYGTENYYGRGLFNKDDYAKINTLLHKIKGKFLMSLNDTPEIRSIFSDFYIETINITHSVQREKHTRSKELLISKD